MELNTTVRKHGDGPFRIAVIHGGPGAPGSVAPIARELSKDIGILEPFQTTTSLDGQIEELKNQLSEFAETPVILIGHSWGAMLSFLVASRYPQLVRKLILVASGVFETKYAERIMPTRLNRLTESERTEVLQLMKDLSDLSLTDRGERMAKFGRILGKADDWNPLPSEPEKDPIQCQADTYSKVWDEAERFRKEGGFLEAGRKIQCPVVAIHGDYDPHPAEGIKKPLSSVLKNFRFILIEKCGHEPWIEREARDNFFILLRKEIHISG